MIGYAGHAFASSRGEAYGETYMIQGISSDVRRDGSVVPAAGMRAFGSVGLLELYPAVDKTNISSWFNSR